MNTKKEKFIETFNAALKAASVRSLEIVSGNTVITYDVREDQKAVQWISEVETDENGCDVVVDSVFGKDEPARWEEIDPLKFLSKRIEIAEEELEAYEISTHIIFRYGNFQEDILTICDDID